jgi:hypothetical protein
VGCQKTGDGYKKAKVKKVYRGFDCSAKQVIILIAQLVEHPDF